MGSFSIWHWIIILGFLAVVVAGLGGLVWLLAKVAKRASR